MVLEALEDAMRSKKAEDLHVTRGLTIEHIMPQAWQAHRPLRESREADPDDSAKWERFRLVQTIGNLTLVTSSLNPAMSNARWIVDPDQISKRGEIAKHSVLHLNKQILESAPTAWDEDSIRDRGERLADLAIKVWPRG